jgi:hypothetical protein
MLTEADQAPRHVKGDITLLERHVIIAVRYSLLAPRLAGSWKIGRDSGDSYRAMLLDPTRLAERQYLFEHITLPSVAAATAETGDIVTELHVLTSADLPKESADFLRRMQARHSFLRVIFQSEAAISLDASTKAIAQRSSPGAIIASVRLDDDDALSRDFLKQLGGYMKPDFSGYVVSLSRGYGGLVDGDGRLVAFANYKWRFASAGLAYIYRNEPDARMFSVFGTGSHTKTDDAFPTVLDARLPAFMRTFHHSNDSGDAFEQCVQDRLAGDDLRAAREQIEMHPRLWSVLLS